MINRANTVMFRGVAEGGRVLIRFDFGLLEFAAYESGGGRRRLGPVRTFYEPWKVYDGRPVDSRTDTSGNAHVGPFLHRVAPGQKEGAGRKGIAVKLVGDARTRTVTVWDATTYGQPDAVPIGRRRVLWSAGRPEAVPAAPSTVEPGPPTPADGQQLLYEPPRGERRAGDDRGNLVPGPR